MHKKMGGRMLAVAALLAANHVLKPVTPAISQEDINAAVMRTLAEQPPSSPATKVYEAVRGSIVHVRAAGQDENRAAGSGLVIVDRGTILTSLHVVAGAGRIRVIGVFTKERSPLMPDIPTFAEQGIDVTSGEGWTGMWTRAGTPPAEIERVQRAVQKVLSMPDVKETLSQRLWAQPNFRDAKQTDALLRAELAHWAPIIKSSGFKPE